MPRSPRRLAVWAMLAVHVAMTAGLANAQEPSAFGVPIAEYAARRSALREAVGSALVVVRGADAPPEDFFRFRQRNDFLYLTGIDQAGATLLLVPEGASGGARSIVFLPPRNPFNERWSGPAIGPGEETSLAFEIDEALPDDSFVARLAEAIAGIDDEGDAPIILTQRPRGRDSEGTPEARLVARIAEAAPEVEIGEVASRLAGLRLIKSEAELALIQHAIDITVEAHRDASRVIAPGAWEYEVQGALEYVFTRSGAQRPSFASIVGSGPNSVVLHYNANRRRMEDGDLVVVDIGAEYDAYAADLTRTYPVSGAFNDRQRAVYQLVLDAQRAAEDAFQPGTSTISDLHRAAVACMKASPLRDSRGRTLDRSFVHGLGHWLGMDVHDVGDYRQPIPPGAVFTIEPGIYLPDEALGVRIEDDYHATADGLVKLSADLPSTPDEVEAMMGAGALPVEASAGSDQGGP